MLWSGFQEEPGRHAAGQSDAERACEHLRQVLGVASWVRLWCQGNSKGLGGVKGDASVRP